MSGAQHSGSCYLLLWCWQCWTCRGAQGQGAGTSAEHWQVVHLQKESRRLGLTAFIIEKTMVSHKTMAGNKHRAAVWASRQRLKKRGIEWVQTGHERVKTF